MMCLTCSGVGSRPFRRPGFFAVSLHPCRRIIMRGSRSVLTLCSVSVLLSLLALVGDPATKTAALADESSWTKLKVSLFALADAHPMQEVIRAMWREVHPEVGLDF